MRREIGVAGPRGAGEVWDRYVRPARWPEWSPQIRAVEYPGERLAAGTSGVVRGPFGVRVPFEVLDVSEDGPVRSWAWRVSAAGARLVLVHTVEAAGAGARTGLTVEGPAALVVAYLPAARWALGRLVR
ncbi:SRPBCC family protein [Spirilliplanes yamanashiensis]|uniref:SRPBCC family protein n=1 Tax=Spirilliplanes yamanashiensis TaxID=42233 RepID=UPI001EF2B827|nr:SRPBCC family protein [Spirilliplanes yamanashiensis]MDP9817319.1 hypothetical protein [Spirilliplanes yamanashiensis]